MGLKAAVCQPAKDPRAKATSPTGTPGPGHSNGFLRLSKLPFASPQTLQNSPNPPNPPNAPNPPKPAKPSKHRPQQAPQIHSNDFLDAFKAALTEARATAMTFYGPQSCSLPACKGSKLPKFQTPSPTCTLGPRQLPQQAPQGQATAMAFLGFQSCRLPARKPSKTLQTLQTLQTFQNLPNPPNTVPSRHLRSTAMTFYGPQSCRLPACKGSKLLKIPNTFPNMHPRAKATSPTGTPGPGHSNGFLRLSKLPFASPQTLQNSPNAPNAPNPPKPAKPCPQQTCQTLQTPSPAGTSDPQQ